MAIAEATSNQITKDAGKKKYSMDVSKSMHNDDNKTVHRYDIIHTSYMYVYTHMHLFNCNHIESHSLYLRTHHFIIYVIAKGVMMIIMRMKRKY